MKKARNSPRHIAGYVTSRELAKKIGLGNTQPILQDIKLGRLVPCQLPAHGERKKNAPYYFREEAANDYIATWHTPQPMQK